MNNMAKWIWFGDDFELFLHNRMSRKRTKRGVREYMAWRVDTPSRWVSFQYKYDIPEDDEVKFNWFGDITIKTSSTGAYFVENFNGTLFVKKGKGVIDVDIYSDVGVPSFFACGKYIKTDERWKAFYPNDNWVPASCLDEFNSLNYGPNDYSLPKKKVLPISVEKINGGTLYDFGKEMLAFPCVRVTNNIKLDIFYGESKEEAIDTQFSELTDVYNIESGNEFMFPESRGCRYIYLKNDDNVKDFYVYEEMYEPPFNPSFTSNSQIVNQIYEISKETLKLTSREFFIDGIKRDRWLWAGDALQSILFDFYAWYDKEIVKRSLIALIGNSKITSNVNCILDYNFYYILSYGFYYEYTGDLDFVKKMFDRILELMDYVMTKRDENGFIQGKDEWVFIDWCDLPGFGEINLKEPIAFIQILYYACLKLIIKFSKLLNKKIDNKYCLALKGLKKKINENFYDEGIGGFYHNASKTMRTRYADIFAILLDFCNTKQQENIVSNLMDDKCKEITTPYMKFYELWALSKSGKISKVLEYVKTYWGGMVNEGATAFWETYDPNEKGIEKYFKDGRKYGKSLCHSWGAGPLFLIGKYIVGLSPCENEEKYKISPYISELNYQAVLPLKNGEIKVSFTDGVLEIFSKELDGILKLKRGGKNVKIDVKKNTPFVLKI